MKKITINLRMPEIIYQVQADTFLTGRCRPVSDPALTANMQACDDETDMNQILRSVGNALAMLQEKVSPYSPEIAAARVMPEPDRDAPPPEDREIEGGNLLTELKDQQVKLSMPDNFNEAFVPALATSMHNSIVFMAIAEWFTKTNPSDATLYYQRAETELEQVKSCCEKRIKRVRRPCGIL